MSTQTLANSSNPAAEQSLLGAVLVRARILDELETQPDDFADLRHRSVFAAMRQGRAAGQPIDAVSLGDRLDPKGERGILAFLGELVDRVPTADNFEHYAAIVADHALKRRIALLVHDTQGAAVRGEQTGEELLGHLRESLGRVATPKLSGIDIGPMSSRLAGERRERLEEAKRLIPFQVAFLDDLLGGMLPHDLVVLTARAGAGKTQLAATIAENAARAGRRPLMFALEAERREIERRLKYRALAKIWNDGVRRGREAGEVRRTLSYAAWCRGEFDVELADFEDQVERSLVAELGDRLQTVYRGKGFSLDDTERVMVAMHERVDLFIIDHLHYLDTPDERTENEAVTAIMERLRDIALRLGKPVLLVAHLRKEDTFRSSLVPRMADLHGSSSIPKIATAVVALAPAPHSSEKGFWHLAPTFMQVLKDRRDGAVPLVAQVVYDKSAGCYRDFYELGRVVRKGNEETFEKITALPHWARRATR